MPVARDAFGIPHVTGDSVLDVAREQGRATATDRSWQLRVERRRVEGRCAELFGEAALEWDRLARRADLPGLARRAHAGMGEESRAFVEAYVAGVNDVLAPAGDEQDEAWQSWTPLGVLAVQHLLFCTFPSKLWRHHLAGAIDPAWLEDLDLLRGEGLPGGSNAVAVAGSLTASGLPIVAGDPHRVLEAPGVYAQVRLVCTDPEDTFDVTGLTFVGVPGVQHFGHATHAGSGVAWGITNAVADAEDLYVEHLTRDGEAVVAHGPVGTEPVQRRAEEIRVRDADGTLHPEQLEVLRTERGPVVLGGPDEVAFSLRTPADVLGDLGGDALLPLLRARTAGDVFDAFEQHWVSPVNNLLVADTTGRPPEHRVVGRVPQREADRAAALHRLPGDARDGTGWSGWVTDLPRRTGEVLVSANDRTSADFARIGDEFAPRFRADRITELVTDLAAAGPITPAALAQVLADDRQTAGGPLLAAVAELEGLSTRGTALRDRLLAWDRRMRADSPDAPLLARVRAHVVRAVVAGPGLRGLDTSPYGDLFAPWFDLGARVQSALPALLAARSTGLARPFGVDLAAAVRDAVEAVAHEPDPEPGTETWGAAHVAVPLTPHQQFGLQPPLAEVPPLLPVAGDTDCVQATRALGGRGACVHGPVARWVWDLAGGSRWVVPLGASGAPVSPHHHDQQAVWAAGGTLPVTAPTYASTGITMRPVDPAADADLLHSWVTQPRAEFWGMTERSRDEVAEIYGWITEQEHLAAYLMEVDGQPLGLIQTYDPSVDEIGDFYDRRPGDLGIHFLLADDPRRRGRTHALFATAFARFLTDPGVLRLVAEPDARNAASVALLERLGAERGPLVDLRTSVSEKPAQFFLLSREGVERLVVAAR